MKLLKEWKLKASVWNRGRKLKYITARISDSDTVLDIGVAPVAAAPRHATNFIDEYFLKTDRKWEALGLECDDFSGFRKRYQNCTMHTFDGMHFPTFERPFDIAVSNAVVEHVGTREQQVQWLGGIAGLCRKLIITTPNRFFPVESHTNALLRHIVSRRFKEELMQNGINLFSEREFIGCLQSAGFRILSVKRNRMFFLTMDFVVECEPAV